MKNKRHCDAAILNRRLRFKIAAAAFVGLAMTFIAPPAPASATPPVSASAAPPAAASANVSGTGEFLREFPSRVKKITLENGMRILIAPRQNSPTVSFAAYIRTGGMDDEFGKSGMAHMFEHMLFKGTKTIGTKNYKEEEPILERIDKAERIYQNELDKGIGSDPNKLKEFKLNLEVLQKEHETYIVEEEYWQIYERAGGTGLNAATGYDYTNYTVSLPVNQIKLWMMMESDRIKNPVLREFYKERDVVREERRQRIDNSPGGRLWEGFLAAAFIAHPYGRPIVGWEKDISRVTRKDAERFFKKHYDISRLVVAVVGGGDPEEIERMFRQYFGNIKSAGAYEPHPIPVEPEQSGERRVVIEYNAEPSMLVGFHRPNMTHPDHAALEVVSQILSTGRTSRFYKTIVEDKQVAVSAWAGSTAPGERDPNLFVMGGSPRSPNTTADLEKMMLKVVGDLGKNGPTPAELLKVKNKLESDVIRALTSNDGLAGQLAYYEAVGGDWKILLDGLKDIEKITEIDVQNAIVKYLKPSNMTVAIIKRTTP